MHMHAFLNFTSTEQSEQMPRSVHWRHDSAKIAKQIGFSVQGNIRGKVVWITGASKGIGAALAIEAARHGAKVAISARTQDKLEETKKRCLG